MTYFFTISMLNIAILLIFGIIIVKSYLLSSHQKPFFVLSILCTVIVIAAEFAISFAENGDLSLIPLHTAGNVVGFALTPFIPMFIGSAIATRKQKFDFVFWIPAGINLICSVLSAFTPLIFTVTAQNEYLRANLFWVFILTYITGLIFLFVKTVQSARSFQNSNNFTLYLLFAFVISGNTVQVLFPAVKISWSCVTFAIFMYYMYYCELYSQIDLQSSLLNKNIYGAYINKNATVKKYSVIFFDIDAFKPINDNFGHQFGDFCISAISSALRNAYFDLGMCFRIGGDEFCVISKTTDVDVLQKAYDKFTDQLDFMRKSEPHLPTVSVGYACYDGEDMSINDVFFSAEREMYKLKKSRKNSADEYQTAEP